MPDEQIMMDFADPPGRIQDAVEWDEVEDAARVAFSFWVDQPELAWAKEQWKALAQHDLTSYDGEFERYAVLFRLLILGGIYSDFCEAAWEYTSEPSYSDWAEPLHLDPFTVGQIYARLPDWAPDDEVTMYEAIETLAENERDAVVDALMEAYGSVTGLYTSLWKSRDPIAADEDAEPAEASDAGDDDEDEDEDEDEDDDYPEDDDTYEPDEAQLAAFSWVDQGCCRLH